MVNEEMYLRKLVDSYEEIIELQKDKIKLLEDELVKIKKSRPIEDPFRDRYDWTKKIEEPEPKKKETETPKFSYAEVLDKSEFGSMSNRIKKEKEPIQDYIARGGVTELKKTQSTPALVNPVTQKPVKELEKRPRAWKRFIYFKSSKEAHEFINRYSKDFEIGKTKKTYWNASETNFHIHKNTTNNDLFSKGYLFVLEFSMNGVDFKILEELENLEGYHQNGAVKKRGGSYKSIRLYKGEKVKV